MTKLGSFSKKMVSICLCLALLLPLLCMAAPAAKAAEPGALPGQGTEQDPYRISTPEDLDALRAYGNKAASNGKFFRLENDIDLTAYLAESGGGHAQWGAKGWQPIEYFAGTPDGAGHTISGMYYSSEGEERRGLLSNLEGVKGKDLATDKPKT